MVNAVKGCLQSSALVHLLSCAGEARELAEVRADSGQLPDEIRVGARAQVVADGGFSDEAGERQAHRLGEQLDAAVLFRVETDLGADRSGLREANASGPRRSRRRWLVCEGCGPDVARDPEAAGPCEQTKPLHLGRREPDRRLESAGLFPASHLRRFPSGSFARATARPSPSAPSARRVRDRNRRGR